MVPYHLIALIWLFLLDSAGILPVSRHAKARNMLTTLLHCLPARLSAKIRLGRAEKVNAEVEVVAACSLEWLV